MSAIYFYDPDDRNGWLANFSSHEIEIAGERWKTVEHYFQSMKFHDAEKKKQIQLASTPEKAKKLAKSYYKYKRKDWKRTRNLFMYNAIRAKFSQHDILKRKLMDTRTSTLIEAANDDAYWGCGSDGNGQNQMGKLLMRLRGHFMEGK